MRIAIAGAGAVGRSIALELVENSHHVLLIDKDPESVDARRVPGAEWLLADACEVAALEDAQIQTFDAMIAASGDDKVNLVVSLLAKTEFGVGRVVARVNHPKNEWMFDEMWGVDVAVSTPRLLSALVEEAVSVGDLVRLMTLRQGRANLVELTLPAATPWAGTRVGDVSLPDDAVLVTIVRDGQVIAPSPDDPLESGDELLFVAAPEAEPAIQELFSPGSRRTPPPALR